MAWVSEGAAYGTTIRPLGIGLLIGGALSGLIVAFPALKNAIKSLQIAAKTSGSGDNRDEMPFAVLKYGFFGILPILFLNSFFSGQDISISTSLLVTVVGTLWLAIAGLIVAQCTGRTDISPLSGLALIAVTLILTLTDNNIVLAVMVGACVCVATSQCADMMQDLKTGYLVGSRPYAQQLMQFCFSWIGPIIALSTVFLLWNATGDGSPGFGPQSKACLEKLPSCLPAPQAGALQGMIEGVVGGNAPVQKYVSGGLVGLLAGLFPISGLGVLLGLAMYLPFSITLGYGLGCIANMIIGKVKGVSFIEEIIVPLAAGFIVGEALFELGHSLLKMIG